MVEAKTMDRVLLKSYYFPYLFNWFLFMNLSLKSMWNIDNIYEYMQTIYGSIYKKKPLYIFIKEINLHAFV